MQGNENEQKKATRVGVEDPKTAFIQFLDKKGDPIVELTLTRINEEKLKLILDGYSKKCYHPFANGDFYLFKNKLMIDFAKVGAIASDVRDLTYEDVPIQDWRYSILGDSYF